jgi:TonB family protein
MNNAATILRIADRFVSPESLNSIQKTGDLKRAILIVSFSYCFAVLSLVPLKYQLDRNRRTIVNNLSIEFALPEPVKVIPIKPPEPAKAAATVSSALGNKAIDKPIANTPAKIVGAKVKTKANDSAQNLSLSRPAANQLQRAVPRPVITVKTNDGSSIPKPIANVAVAPVQAPAVIGTPAKEAVTGGGNQPHANGGGEPGAGGQTGNGGAAGDGRGAQGQQIAMTSPQTANVATAMGNIAPYRKDMLLRLAANWHPKKHKEGNIVVVITLSKDGHLLNTELVTSSGNDKLDEYALQTVGKTDFAPLPDWFRGAQLRLKVELAKVEAVKNDI